MAFARVARTALEQRVGAHALRPVQCPGGDPTRSSDKLADLRDALVDTCTAVLFQYRIVCATRSPAGQLILPESVKLLPLLSLGTFKNALLGAQHGDNSAQDAATMQSPNHTRDFGALFWKSVLGRTRSETQKKLFFDFVFVLVRIAKARANDASAVFSVASRRRALSMPVEECVLLAYPRLFALDDPYTHTRASCVLNLSERERPTQIFVSQTRNRHAQAEGGGSRVDDVRGRDGGRRRVPPRRRRRVVTAGVRWNFETE